MRYCGIGAEDNPPSQRATTATDRGNQCNRVLWILLMVKAYQGERYKVPVAGDIAEKYL